MVRDPVIRHYGSETMRISFIYPVPPLVPANLPNPSLIMAYSTKGYPITLSFRTTIHCSLSMSVVVERTITPNPGHEHLRTVIMYVPWFLYGGCPLNLGPHSITSEMAPSPISSSNLVTLVPPQHCHQRHSNRVFHRHFNRQIGPLSIHRLFHQ